MSDHFTGVALELKPSSNFKTHDQKPVVTVEQLTGKISGIYSALTQIFLLSVTLQLFVVLAPFYMQWVVDQALVSADYGMLVVLAVGFGLVMVLQVGIGILRGWTVIYLSSRLGMQWMSNVFVHALKLPLDFFEKRHLGDITSRMMSVQTIQHTLTTSFIEAVIDGMMAIATLALMFVYSWKLALVTLLAVGCYFIIRRP